MAGITSTPTAKNAAQQAVDNSNQASLSGIFSGQGTGALTVPDTPASAAISAEDLQKRMGTYKSSFAKPATAPTLDTILANRKKQLEGFKPEEKTTEGVKEELVSSGIFPDEIESEKDFKRAEGAARVQLGADMLAAKESNPLLAFTKAAPAYAKTLQESKDKQLASERQMALAARTEAQKSKTAGQAYDLAITQAAISSQEKLAATTTKSLQDYEKAATTFAVEGQKTDTKFQNDLNLKNIQAGIAKGAVEQEQYINTQGDPKSADSLKSVVTDSNGVKHINTGTEEKPNYVSLDKINANENFKFIPLSELDSTLKQSIFSTASNQVPTRAPDTKVQIDQGDGTFKEDKAWFTPYGPVIGVAGKGPVYLGETNIPFYLGDKDVVITKIDKGQFYQGEQFNVNSGTFEKGDVRTISSTDIADPVDKQGNDKGYLQTNKNFVITKPNRNTNLANTSLEDLKDAQNKLKHANDFIDNLDKFVLGNPDFYSSQNKNVFGTKNTLARFSNRTFGTLPFFGEGFIFPKAGIGKTNLELLDRDWKQLRALSTRYPVREMELLSGQTQIEELDKLFVEGTTLDKLVALRDAAVDAREVALEMLSPPNVIQYDEAGQIIRDELGQPELAARPSYEKLPVASMKQNDPAMINLASKTPEANAYNIGYDNLLRGYASGIKQEGRAVQEGLQGMLNSTYVNVYMVHENKEYPYQGNLYNLFYQNGVKVGEGSLAASAFPQLYRELP